MDISKERLRHLLGKALEWSGESESGYDLYDTFRNVMGMSDEEIECMGFTTLREFFAEAEQQPNEPAPGMTADETAFAAQMQQIIGADMGRLGAWLEHMRSLADVDAETLSASADACHTKLLGDFGSVFQEMEQKYPGSAAAIFNYKEGYLPNELLPAADWINQGGTAEEAYAMAQDGAFDLGTFVTRAITQAEFDAIRERHYNYLHNLPGGECADFSGKVLSGLEMRRMDFSGANFNGAAFEGCDIEHGRFDGCVFTGTHFYGVQAGNACMELSDFTGAHFEGSNFRHANFENSNCSGTVFEYVNLDRANLDLCVFYGAQFIYTKLDSVSAILAKGLTVNRPNSEAQAALEVTHARHTLWRYGEPGGERGDFRDNSLEKLDFSGKNFDGALFWHTELSCCDLNCCSLTGAEFNYATLAGCSFRNAFCQDASFAGAQMCNCDFTDAQLDIADFAQADIQDCEGLEDQSPGPTMTMSGG